MKLRSYTLGAMIFILLFGGISLSSAMNWWKTESTKVPVTYTEGEAAGQYNPADIRGSYNFGEVSELFDVPLRDLQSAFRIPADVDPAAYQLKSLEEQFTDLPVEMGTGSVRLFVAFYKGLPFDLSTAEDTYLFPEAESLVRAQAKMTAEQSVYLENHIVQEPGEELAPAEEAPVIAPTENSAAAPVETEHVPPADTVTGKTTFQDLLDWGISQATIESILGTQMPPASTPVKDFATSKGLEFSTVKAQFQAELDKLK